MAQEDHFADGCLFGCFFWLFVALLVFGAAGFLGFHFVASITH